MWDQNLTYHHIYNNFKWNIPDNYNIGYDICEKWSKTTPENPAIIDIKPSDLFDLRYLKAIKNSN